MNNRPLMDLMLQVPLNQWRYGQSPDPQAERAHQTLDIATTTHMSGIEFTYDSESDQILYANRSIDGEELQPFEVIDHLVAKVMDDIHNHPERLDQNSRTHYVNDLLESLHERHSRRYIVTERTSVDAVDEQDAIREVVQGGDGEVVEQSAELVGEEPAPLTGDQALARIYAILDGKEWEAGTLDEIAEVVESYGHTIHPPRNQTNPVWEDNEVQFARLISEILSTHEDLDLSDVADAMDVSLAEVSELIDRASEVWEHSKVEQVPPESSLGRLMSHLSGLYTPQTEEVLNEEVRAAAGLDDPQPNVVRSFLIGSGVYLNLNVTGEGVIADVVDGRGEVVATRAKLATDWFDELSEGLRMCDKCGRMEEASNSPDWVNGMCLDCDPKGIGPEAWMIQRVKLEFITDPESPDPLDWDWTTLLGTKDPVRLVGIERLGRINRYPDR